MAARKKAVGLRLARAGLRLGLAAAFMLGAADALQNAVAEGDTRTLTFHHLHTGEDITITYKRDGRYDEAALKKLDWFMRDWRKQQSTHMDPHLFDLLWAAYRELGATQPIQVVCGYRSPGTNAMLRARSSGVAQFSQHTLGHAMDFFIPGVPLASLRAVGLQLQRGGVGFYPSSGSPFVHMDTGTVRHWPSIPREQLVKILPGRAHRARAFRRPSAARLKLALAEVEKHGNAPNARSLEAARAAGMINDRDDAHRLALVAQQRSQTQSTSPMPATTSPLSGQARARHHGAGEPRRQAGRDQARGADADRHDRNSRRSRLPNRRHRGRRRSKLPRPGAMLRDRQRRQQGARLCAGSRCVPRRTVRTCARARPMGARLPQLTAAVTREAPAMLAIASKAAPTLVSGGQKPRQPLDARDHADPERQPFMTMTWQGGGDPRWLAELMDKPSQALAMTFGADPQSAW